MPNLLTYIQKFNQLEVAVVGDLMMDKYTFGRATRISQEAPVPVVCVDRQNAVPGGAANVALNLLSLHAKADVFGIVGQDKEGGELTNLLKDAGADTDGIIAVPQRQTTVKTRVFASHQQVVRIDVEDTSDLQETYQTQLLQKLEARLQAAKLDAVIMEDYAKGVFTRSFMENISALAAKYNVPLMLDPHPTHPFDVKGIRLMTPNRQEAFTLAGKTLTKETGNPLTDAPLLEVGKLLNQRWDNDILNITLGGEGMAIFLGGSSVPLHIPTKARKVFDVSGAGDTVMAAMTLAILAGATPQEAAQIANYAAGIVVGIVGTAAIQQEALVAAIKQEAILNAIENNPELSNAIKK